jgi:predicted nucleotidyltransferase
LVAGNGKSFDCLGILRDMSNSFEDLVGRAEADPNVVGLVLTGSQARGMATRYSDADVFVIVPERGGQWSATSRTPELDTIIVSLAELADVSDRWQRYAYRGARVLLDRLDGQIADLVHAQATLTPAESEAWVREQLDGYINFIYRAAKNRRDGRYDLARLEEIEAAPWFLWTMFALYGRVRPYNKYLRWELETYPLPQPWTADHLISALTDRPSTLFRDLEMVARSKGFADVLDAWDELDIVCAGEVR